MDKGDMSKKSSMNSTSNSAPTSSQQSAVIAASQNPSTLTRVPSQISITFIIGQKSVIGFKADSGYTFYKRLSETPLPLHEKSLTKILNIFVEALNHENYTIRMNARGFLYSKRNYFSPSKLNNISFLGGSPLLLVSKFAMHAQDIYDNEEELYSFAQKALVFERFYHLQLESTAYNEQLRWRGQDILSFRRQKLYTFSPKAIFLQCTIKKYQQLIAWGKIPKGTYVIKRPGQFKEEYGPIVLSLKIPTSCVTSLSNNGFITNVDIQLDKNYLVKPEYLYSPNKYFWHVHDLRNTKQAYNASYSLCDIRYNTFGKGMNSPISFHFFDPFYLEHIKTIGYDKL